MPNEWLLEVSKIRWFGVLGSLVLFVDSLHSFAKVGVLWLMFVVEVTRGQEACLAFLGTWAALTNVNESQYPKNVIDNLCQSNPNRFYNESLNF